MRFDLLCWFFIDLNFVIVCCLWWKVEFGDGFVVFENGSVVGNCCFYVGVESAKTFAFAIKVDLCSVSLPTLGHTSESSGRMYFLLLSFWFLIEIVLHGWKVQLRGW